MARGDDLRIECELDEAGGRVLFKPSGDLLASNSDQFRNEILQAITPTLREVVLDLSQVKFIDSTGLGTMMGLKSTCTKRKVNFALTNVSTGVGDILRLTRIDRFFTFV